MDETLRMEDDVDISSGDDSMNDPDFSPAVTHDAEEASSSNNNKNDFVKHNKTEVSRWLETSIEKSRNLNDSLANGQQIKSSEHTQTHSNTQPSKTVLLEDSLDIVKDDHKSLSNLRLVSPAPASKTRVVSLQSNSNKLSEIRNYGTGKIGCSDEEVLTESLAHAGPSHCIQKMNRGVKTFLDENSAARFQSTNEGVKLNTQVYILHSVPVF